MSVHPNYLTEHFTCSFILHGLEFRFNQLNTYLVAQHTHLHSFATASIEMHSFQSLPFTVKVEVLVNMRTYLV